MRTLRQLRNSLAGRLKYRMTRGGWLYALAVLIVAAGAAVSANNLLFLILAMMLSSVLVSGFVSRLCLAGLELDLIVPEHVTARRAVTGKLYVRNGKFGVPSFSIHVVGLGEPPILAQPVYFPVIPSGAVAQEAVELRFSKRGVYAENGFIFSTRFPFGFLEKTARVVLTREVLVYPSIDVQLGFEELLGGIAGEIETHYRGLGRDFYRIRPYDSSESARHVDWRATAHTGSLQVREFAREQERAVEIFLDRHVPEGMATWFEQAVECCAFICWRLSQQGAGIRFRSQRVHWRLPEECDVYTILKFLALAAPDAPRPVDLPADDTSFQILLSASPERFISSGWTPARVLGPGAFSGSLEAADGRA